MQCSRCGTALRTGMAECPSCGAPVSSAGSSPAYRPGGAAVQQGYIPGGGQPKQTQNEEEPAPPPRPLGSLQRRLQQSQNSSANDDEAEDEFDGDAWNPRGARPRGGKRSPRPNEGSRGSQGGRPRRPPTGSGGFSERDQPRRPSQRPFRGEPPRGGSRGRGYEDSQEESAYAPSVRWDDDSREAPARPAARDRYRPADDSVEMSAEVPAYTPPRPPTPRHKSRPLDQQRDVQDYSHPLDDPRAPSRGSQSRRPSQGGGRPRRNYDDYDQRDERRAPPRPVEPYTDYTDAQIGAPPGYTDYGAARGAAGGYDDYDRSPRGGSRSTGRDARGRGAYAPPRQGADYTDFGASAAPGWPDTSGFPGTDASAWQPAVSAPSRSGGSRGRATGRDPGRDPGARRPAKQRKRGLAGTVFWMFTMLLMAAGLGVEVGPQLYRLVLHKSLGGGNTPQTSVACSAETTPTATGTPTAGSTVFATTSYSMSYPSTWQKNVRSGSSQGLCDFVFQFSDPNSAATITIEQAGAFATLSDNAIIQAEAQSAQSQGSSFSEITSAASTQSIGGAVWQRHEYQVTAKSGGKVHLALLATHHGGSGYAIILLSSDTGFAADDTNSFEPALHSFQFT